jgi:hypothetical protein
MPATTFNGQGFADAQAVSRLKRIKRLAWLVDAAFVIPGTTFRFGLNSVIGLAPGAGDAVLGAISLYIIHQASLLGVPRPLLMRMIGNVVVEVVGGSIPVLGDLFDVALKANLRNIRLLEDHLSATQFRAA